MTTYSNDSKYGERIAGVEVLLKHVLEGQVKLEIQINNRFDKFEQRYEKRLEQLVDDCQKLDAQLVSHEMEEARIYKSLKNRIIEYIVIAVVASIIASIVILR